MKTNNISRRDFLRRLGIGSAVIGTAAATGCSSKANKAAGVAANREVPTDKMTMRVNTSTGDSVSILGFGCMRYPTVDVEKDGEMESVVDQDAVNQLVDYAMAHGINYYDTSPAYCKGTSEHATGIALARHPRDKYFIATKLSNFAPSTWSFKAGTEMFENSLRELQTPYVDYLLLHAIGMHAETPDGHELNGMEAMNARYFDNGLLDWLVEQKKAGRIRNLGFSYHGDQEAFDHLLALHDEGKYHWDFVQIQLNYLDWKHARELNPRNTDAEYLYGELQKRGIPSVIMEPLLGGRLASVPDVVAEKMHRRTPENSVASWAFRFAGTPEGVLTVLSGMTYMEHLQDNLLTYSPLDPVEGDDHRMLLDMADVMVKFPTVPCTACEYCMPCPYGIDIPSNFRHYNKCVNEGNVVASKDDSAYAKARRAFLVGYDRSVPRLRQASHCIGCAQCTSHCPQGIDIPGEMHRIDAYVEQLKTQA